MDPDEKHELGEKIHSITFSENGEFIALGANNVSAVIDRSSGKKVKVCDAAAFDKARNQKIVQRFVNGQFLSRFNKSVRVWKIHEEHHGKS